ncbi:MAG: PAS domain-containing protein [Sphingobacterium sp.]
MPINFDYSQLFRALDLPIIILYPDGSEFVILDANNAYLDLVCKSLEEIQGKGYFYCFPFSPYVNHHNWTTTFDTVLTQKKTVNTGIFTWLFPITEVSTPKDIRYFDITHSPVLDKDGEIVFIVRSLKDVTKLVGDREVLLEAQQTAQFGYWWINLEKNSMYWTNGLKDILEVQQAFKPDFENTKVLYETIGDEIAFLEAIKASIENRMELKTTIRVRTGKGNLRQVLVIGKPIIFNNICIGLNGIARDITEVHGFIDRLKLLDNELLEIEFQQSHMIRGPLSRILGLIDHLRTFRTPDRATENLLSVISDSAEELDDIIAAIVNKTQIHKDSNR